MLGRKGEEMGVVDIDGVVVRLDGFAGKKRLDLPHFFDPD